MNNHSPTIVLTGGGSGGHITPLLSLARELKRLEPASELIYIGHKGDKFDNLELSAHDFDFTSFINGGKFRRYHGEGFFSHLLDVKTIALNIRDVFRVINATRASLKILRKVNPDVVFSKGGFVAVPVGIAAKLLHIPIVTHDSDTVAGLANRIIGRWAKINATGMPSEFYSYPKSRVRYVGIPLEEHIKLVHAASQKVFKKDVGIPTSSTLLLVSGGGNGSRSINQLIVRVAPKLLESNLALYIAHISGAQHEESLKREYGSVLSPDLASRVQIIGFTPEHYKFSGAADLIVGRAGATSISEYATEAKACVIIPSAFLAGGHQLKNADYLKQHDAAVVSSDNVSPDEMLVILSELLNNAPRRAELASNLHRLSKPEPAKELAKILIDVAKGRF